MNKAIVLGATGLVGSNVVRFLAQSRNVERVVAVTRKPITYANDKVHNCVVNFDQINEYRDAFEGDALFSCLGTTLKLAGSLDAQRLVDFDYQYTCAAIAADNGVGSYFLVSSSGANASSLSPYLKMKGELENAVRRLDFKRIDIFQPSLLLGQRAESRTAEGLGSLILPTLCKLPGLTRFRPIQGADVAQKMVEVSQADSTGVNLYRLAECFPDSD